MNGSLKMLNFSDFKSIHRRVSGTTSNRGMAMKNVFLLQKIINYQIKYIYIIYLKIEVIH